MARDTQKKGSDLREKKEVTGEAKKETRKTAKPTQEALRPLKAEAKAGSLMFRVWEHAERVRNSVESLFDQTKATHQLEDLWRDRILWAALLHDVGVADGKKGHHKASKKRILKEEKFPLSATDRPFVALMARFHRKAMPSIMDRELMTLQREDRKKMLAAIEMLRFADGLDCGWKGTVKRFTVKNEGGVLLFTLEGEGKLKKAFKCAKGKAKKLFGCKVKALFPKDADEAKAEKKAGKKADKKAAKKEGKKAEKAVDSKAEKKTVKKPNSKGGRTTAKTVKAKAA